MAAVGSVAPPKRAEDRRCGQATDVECLAGRVSRLVPASRHGFAVDEAEVTFWGIFPNCQEQIAGAGQGVTLAQPV